MAGVTEVQDNSLPQEHHSHIKRIYLYILVLVVVVLGIFMTLYKSQNPSQQTQVNQEEQIETRGSLTVKSDKDSYKVGEPVTFEVLADSNDADIVGFDILLKYDHQKFSKPQVVTSLDGFQVFSNINGDHLTMTGIQSPNSEVRSNFSNNQIVTITLTPQQKGNFEFSLIRRSDKETTKMMDSKTEKLQPALSNVSISVE